MERLGMRTHGKAPRCPPSSHLIGLLLTGVYGHVVVQSGLRAQLFPALGAAEVYQPC